MSFDNIPDSELFADLQQSATDIILIESLTNEDIAKGFESRLDIEKEVLQTIKKEIRDRFTDSQIEKFLLHGYERKIVLR